ncbi:MAG: FlgD immunoglobulin-like domain containing protein [Candidatus Eisenbacteria bacterium]
MRIGRILSLLTLVVLSTAVANAFATDCPSFVLSDNNVMGLFYQPGTPATLWVTSAPDIYNADVCKIWQLNATDGTVLRESGRFAYNGRGICYAWGSLWVVDALQDVVHELDPADFHEKSRFYTPGSEPCGITFDGTYLWLTDPWYGRIYKLTSSGTVVGGFSFGSSGYYWALDWDFDGGGMWTNSSATQLGHHTEAGVCDDTYQVTCLPSGSQIADLAIGSGVWYVSTFTNSIYRVPPPPDQADIDVNPDVLNPRSGGRWITCYIELAEGYDPADIDVSTVMLNETVPAEMAPTAVGDYDGDMIPDLMVKFSRSAVIEILPGGEHVEVRVSGEVAGQPFVGTDTIRVLMPKVTYPKGGEVLEIGHECTITWEIPAGCRSEWYDVYYTSDDGSSWNLVAGEVLGTSCAWVIPDVASAQCRVLVEAHDAIGTMGYAISDQTFIVSSAGAPGDEAIPKCVAFYSTGRNPSTQGGVFQLDLPKACHVKVAIQDVCGRQVRELIDEARSAGSYPVQWDGRDGLGAGAPQGIYFIRVEAGQDVATGKVVIVR